MSAIRGGTVAAVGMLVLSPPLTAQQIRVRLTTQAQSVSFRGWDLDSVPLPGPGVPRVGPNGEQIECRAGAPYCTYYGAGTPRRAAPVVTTADGVLWGMGVRGLRIRSSLRFGTDLSGGAPWPGTDPAMQVVEAYAELDRGPVRFQAGRTYHSGRLGYLGYDGANTALRLGDRWRVGAFGGLGLAQGVAQPVTSGALTPLDEYQPRDRQLVFGAHGTLSIPRLRTTLAYHREVDPRANDFVSERVAVDVGADLPGSLALRAGAEYNLAEGRWGTSDATLSVVERQGRVAARVTARRYRPYFPLWTIWGAFAPAAHHAVAGRVTAAPLPNLDVRVNGEVFWYSEAGTASPLVPTRTDGWRWDARVRFQRSGWWVSARRHEQIGPGASVVGFDGTLALQLHESMALRVAAGRLQRPLEFRFSDAAVTTASVDVTYAPVPTLDVVVRVQRFAETRTRPDTPVQWDQFRLALGVRTWFGSAAPDADLPAAILRIPPRQVGR